MTRLEYVGVLSLTGHDEAVDAAGEPEPEPEPPPRKQRQAEMPGYEPTGLPLDEFLARDYQIRWLIRRLLVAGP